VRAIVAHVRTARPGVYRPHVYVVREDGEPALRQAALACLILDRAEALPSYQQFLQQLKDKVSGACSWWVSARC
jgi:protein transport protein SEC24